MENPFDYNQKNLESGFYYDNRLNLICFYYLNKDEESYSSSVSIYNRNMKSTNLPSFIIPRNTEKESVIEDLIELTLNKLHTKESLLKDFLWIKSNTQVAQYFVNFLIREEKYEILELFYLTVKTKEKWEKQ